MSDIQQAAAGNAVADFLKNNSGNYAPAFKFDRIGATVGGTITRVQVISRPNLRDGAPEQNLIIELVDGNGEAFSVWIPESKPKMVNAVLTACREAGVAGPMVGDLLRINFSGETPATKQGYNPSKDFTAAYKRGGNGTAAVPQAAPEPVPAASAQPSADNLI